MKYSGPLRAVEMIQDIPERLRVLADEIPEGTRAVIVITIPDVHMYNFGEALTAAEAVGYMTAGAHKMAGDMK